MTTRLDFLCSASTAGLRADAFPTADDPLDVKGRAAAARLTGRFQGYGTVLTSPARCAKETAESMELPATPEPALRDCDFGRWAGRALTEIGALEPEALALWLSDPEAGPHGGESFVDVATRVGAWMDALAENSGAILAITHAAVLRAAIVHALGAPARSLLHIDVGPLSLAKLSGGNGRWRLSAFAPLKAKRQHMEPIGRPSS